MQNTLQQLRLHAVHNQSAPLWVEVMTSTHPAFNLFCMELHIPWLLIARGAFGEQGKQVKVLLLPMARDSRKALYVAWCPYIPSACLQITGGAVISHILWVLHLLAVNTATSFETNGLDIGPP